MVRPGHTVYDLGANVGFYTLLASVLVGQPGHVYAFEPLQRNIEYLRKHLALNAIENCSIVEAAVTSCEGYSPFDFSTAHTNAHLSQTGQNTVRTVTLDSLVRRGEILPPNVMKIDIEGAELGALEGSRRTIAEHRPVLFLATHGHEVHNACLQLLLKQNYDLESLTSDPIESTAELLALPK
jgi:FkbM family methyltransferase